MARLKYLVPALVLGLIVCSLRVAPQPPPQPPNMMEALNKRAEAADVAGIHAYAEELMQMLPSVRDAGSTYADSLTDRLARAELQARNGKRKLISEAEIAEAFNGLMRRTKAPASLKADLVAVESARSGWEKQLPAMISNQKNGTNCYPGEAVWVLETLIENVGRPPGSIVHSTTSVFVSVPQSPARRHLEQFSASHSQSEVSEMLSHLLSDLTI